MEPIDKASCNEEFTTTWGLLMILATGIEQISVSGGDLVESRVHAESARDLLNRWIEIFDAQAEAAKVNPS